MADVRGTRAAVLTDPTTGTQQAGVDASGNLQVIAAANSGVDIGDVDILSVIPGTGATNLGKAEDAVHSTGDTGVYVLAVRDDALAAHSGTDGDYESLHTNASGALWVAGNGTFTVTDDGSFTLAANSGVDIGDVDVLTCGTITPGTAAANLGKAEDAAHTSGDVGVMALAVRQDTAAALGGTDADYQPLITDASGRLHVTDPNAGAGTPTSPSIDITNITTPVSIGAGSSSNLDSADVATKKLTQAMVAGAAPFKVVFATLSGGTPTDVGVAFGDAFHSVIWNTPHKDYVVSGTTVAGFRAAVTNLDPNDTTDFYASFAYED